MPEEIKTAQTTVDTEVDSHADVDTTKDDVNDVEFTDTPGEPPLRRKPEQLKQRNRTPKTLAVGVRQNAKPNSKERRRR